MKHLIAVFLPLLITLFFKVDANAITRYVKPSASGNGSGSDWNNASANLQAMIDASAAGDEVWVAAGTYKPTSFTGASGTLTARDVSFVLKSGVKVYGGFAGTETQLSQRSVAANITILSGDIGTVGITSDNAYHVVVTVNNSAATLLDGFTITAGIADGAGGVLIGNTTVYRASGGGIFARGSHAKFANIIINKNSSITTAGKVGFGGGIYSLCSSITLEDAAITENTAPSVGTEGGRGGALYAIGNADTVTVTVFKRTTVKLNSARTLGGAIFLGDFSSLDFDGGVVTENTATNSSGGALASRGVAGGTNTIALKNLEITKNKTQTGSGGALMLSYYTRTTITDCLISENTCVSDGAGIWLQGNTGVDSACELTMTNVNFTDNKATDPGLSGRGGAVFASGNMDFTAMNCNFIDNFALRGIGAVFLSGNANRYSECKITGGVFSGNSSPLEGGALTLSSNVNYTIEGVRFIKNVSDLAGGALVLAGSGSATTTPIKGLVSNCLFFDNEAKRVEYGGGAIHVTNTYGDLSIVNSTFYNNKARKDGGAISMFDIATSINIKLNIYNSIFYGNTSSSASSADIFKGTRATINIKNSLTQQYGTNGTDGLIVGVNPNFLFTDSTNPQFLYLNPQSPVIDKGNNAYIPDGVTKDLAGNARINNNTVDMGAYEYSGSSQPNPGQQSPQTITFANITKTYGEHEFDPGARSSSGLPVAYESSNTAVAIIENGQIRIVGAGTAQITAKQQGNAQYYPAADVTVTLTVNKTNLSIRPVDESIVSGQPIPSFNISYSGFVGTDNEDSLISKPVISTTATVSSAPGTYPITALGASSNNYNISYIPGVLTITSGGATARQGAISAWFDSSSNLKLNYTASVSHYIDIAVYTTLGVPVLHQKIQAVNGTNEYNIPLGNLQKGIYILNVEGQTAKLNKKLIKK